MADLSKLEAEEQMRLITAITFPHWSGKSKNPKEANRQGNRRRTQYMDTLKRAAGLDADTPLLTTGEQLERWFHNHGLSTA